MGKKLRLCLCSICRDLTHLDNGEYKPGVIVEVRTWKTHAADDELRRFREDHLVYTALVASAGERPSPHVPRVQDGTDFEVASSAEYVVYYVLCSQTRLVVRPPPSTATTT